MNQFEEVQKFLDQLEVLAADKETAYLALDAADAEVEQASRSNPAALLGPALLNQRIARASLENARRYQRARDIEIVDVQKRLAAGRAEFNVAAIHEFRKESAAAVKEYRKALNNAAALAAALGVPPEAVLPPLTGHQGSVRVDASLLAPGQLAERLQRLAAAAAVRDSEALQVVHFSEEMRLYGEGFVAISDSIFRLVKEQSWDNRRYEPGNRVDRWRIAPSILWNLSRGRQWAIPAEGVTA